MVSNSGIGLIVGNGKRSQFYRASNAVYEPEKHGVSEIIVQKCSGIISSVPLTIINHQSATSEEFNLCDASSPKVRIDDAMSPIRDESRKRYACDAQFSNFRKTMTFDTQY